jgi:D-arabinose 1-dehydrogenase-like Zn-dependent alcohol dehydrogenase
MAVEAFGRPLVPVELKTPEPGPGEVLVKVLACGVCRTDLKIVDGHMPFSRAQRLPHVPGHEIGGEVIATGPGVAVSVGQRIVVYNYWGCGRCPYCIAGEENLCDALRGWVGFTTPGGFQEYLVAPADHVLPVPPQVSAVESATMSCALGTGYHAVVARGGVRPGEMVVVLGAGGVGLHALQFARVAGATTVAIDIEETKLVAARQLGADEAIVASQAVSQVGELTGGDGADVVVDCVGTTEATIQAAALTRKGGRIVQVGYTTDRGQYPILPTDKVALHELSVIGSRYITRPELARAIDLVARGMVRPVVSEVLELSQVNEALHRVRRDQAVGRIVLQIASER